jgi:uncharacterized membrane protein
MRIVVIIFLVLILASLGSALFFMMKHKDGDPKRMARALTLRVGLSITLFIMLMASYYFGFIPGKL